MNNYHLFLIRSDQVTQIVGHLVAGIVTLLLISSLNAPDADRLSEVRPTQVTEMKVTLPAGVEMIAAAK